MSSSKPLSVESSPRPWTLVGTWVCLGLGVGVPHVEALVKVHLTMHLKWCILLYVSYTLIMLS